MPSPAEFEDFDRDLVKIEELIQFVIAFRTFGATPPTPDDEQSEFVQSATGLHRVSGQIRTDLPILVGSLLLYACGRFEYFAGELIKSAADKELGKADSYADLSKEIQESLRARLLIVLSDPGKYSHLKLSDQHLASTLAKIVAADPAEAPADIPTEILASTDSNMRPQILKEVFLRVGIKDVWGEISKQAPLRTHFEATSEGSCKASATNFLEELMRLRNSIAHPTASLTFPSPEAALELCSSLRELSRAISDVANLPR